MLGDRAISGDEIHHFIGDDVDLDFYTDIHGRLQMGLETCTGED